MYSVFEQTLNMEIALYEFSIINTVNKSVNIKHYYLRSWIFLLSLLHNLQTNCSNYQDN